MDNVPIRDNIGASLNHTCGAGRLLFGIAADKATDVTDAMDQLAEQLGNMMPIQLSSEYVWKDGRICLFFGCDRLDQEGRVAQPGQGEDDGGKDDDDDDDDNENDGDCSEDPPWLDSRLCNDSPSRAPGEESSDKGGSSVDNTHQAEGSTRRYDSLYLSATHISTREVPAGSQSYLPPEEVLSLPVTLSPPIPPLPIVPLPGATPPRGPLPFPLGDGPAIQHISISPDSSDAGDHTVSSSDMGTDVDDETTNTTNSPSSGSEHITHSVSEWQTRFAASSSRQLPIIVAAGTVKHAAKKLLNKILRMYGTQEARGTCDDFLHGITVNM